MRNLWRDRRVFGSLVVTLVLLILMLLTSDPGRPYGRLERLWVEFVTPLGKVLDTFGEDVGGTVGYILKHPSLVRENRELNERLLEMESIESEIVLLQRENERLRSLLSLQRRLTMPSVAGRIYARSPSDWNREVVIDRGEDHGVSRGDVVVAPEGLVGRIISTSTRTSRALLITSPDSGLGIEVASSGYAGVAEGQMLHQGRIKITMFSPNARISMGDLLVTSGYGESYPAGIPVGYILDLDEEETGLVREAWLTPAARLDNLSEVLILEGVSGGTVNWSDIVGAFESEEPEASEEAGN
ncbi:MAG: rod shape-determining protein MreC [Bacillota bacterium]